MIKTPVRFDEATALLLDADERQLADILAFAEMINAGPHIATCINDHETLTAQVAELKGEIERLREENQFILSPDDLTNLCECVTDELAIQLGVVLGDPGDEIPRRIENEIREWFATFSENQAAGMPEYENHRY
jgi:hypothetical protein